MYSGRHVGIYHVSILPRNKKKKEGGIIRTDSRHFVKNESTQINIWQREKTTLISRNSTIHLLQPSFPFLGGASFHHSHWGLELLTKLFFPLHSFVDIWFQCFTAVLILFCLSDNKDIVVTKYYANCFCLVLKIRCTALF